jgi:hypothetical protein
MHAPIGSDGTEPTFQYLGDNVNPIRELSLAPEKKTYLTDTLGNFNTFSDEIMRKSLGKK